MKRSGSSLEAPDTVLVIDDSPENRLLLSSQLSMEGYQILQAHDGYDGLRIAREHNPEIILLDVMMPDINGFEVCKQLKAEPTTHLIPIIMVTALRDIKHRIEGIEAGADEFLSRPHNREELLVRVRTLIRLKRARVGLEEERNRLQLLYDISQAIGAELDPDILMATIIDKTQKAVGATKGNIMLLNEAGEVDHKFLVRAGSAVEISDRVTNEVMSRGLGGWLVRHRHGDIIEDIQQDERWITLPDDPLEQGSAIGVPLVSPKKVVGVIILNHPQVNYFNKQHLSLLETIGTSVASALENANYFTEISEERRKLGAILTQSTDAIITTDEDWIITRINNAAETLFALDAQEVTNKSIRDVPELSLLTPIFANASSRVAPEEVHLHNGKTLYASISPIQEVGYAAVIQDVTEFKKIEEMRLAEERREQQLLKDTFSRYMGQRLVEHVMSHEPGLLSRRERRRAVVMFADLRNWTSGMIMKIEPDEAINQLNEFFTKMMEIALEFDGTVFEMTGDEILVGFNAPFDQPDAPLRALQTALTMQQEFNMLRRGWYEQAGTELGLGIGVDLGDVVLGNVGAESRMSYRMVGEPMNTAHRLVDLAEDGQVIISQVVYQALHEKAPDYLQRIRFEKIGPIALKGITPPQTLYRTMVERLPFVD
ncbi:MAG: response regulator [Ardenticatenaceae bacterium]|nr:response regulator [Ardenticatenaceae bacterium]MCB8987016.1 response regulator [Ardenticatenaceae bacterium]